MFFHVWLINSLQGVEFNPVAQKYNIYHLHFHTLSGISFFLASTPTSLSPS